MKGQAALPAHTFPTPAQIPAPTPPISHLPPFCPPAPCPHLFCAFPSTSSGTLGSGSKALLREQSCPHHPGGQWQKPPRHLPRPLHLRGWGGEGGKGAGKSQQTGKSLCRSKQAPNLFKQSSKTAVAEAAQALAATAAPEGVGGAERGRARVKKHVFFTANKSSIQTSFQALATTAAPKRGWGGEGGGWCENSGISKRALPSKTKPLRRYASTSTHVRGTNTI